MVFGNSDNPGNYKKQWTQHTTQWTQHSKQWTLFISTTSSADKDDDVVVEVGPRRHSKQWTQSKKQWTLVGERSGTSRSAMKT